MRQIVCVFDLHPPTAEAILRLGCDVDALDGDGLTPLLLAVRFNLVAEARALLEAGARMGRSARCYEDGRTAFHLAAGRSTTGGWVYYYFFFFN